MTVNAPAWPCAFSTLGCAGMPLAGVVDLAIAEGWDGLELRAAPGEPVHVGLTTAERIEARHILEAAGITPLAIASYVQVDNPSMPDAVVIDDLLAHLQLAADVGASFVRVFPGGPSSDGAAIRRLEKVAARLDDLPDVAVGLETHDSCPTGAATAKLLARVDHPRVQAVWDVQHPWRAGEAVADTLEALDPVLAYVQITDARSIDDQTPCLLGTGVVPLREARDELARHGYDGWVSLEWASYWYPDSPPLTAALPGARRWFADPLWGADG